MIARKAAPALPAGCTFVGRPARETALLALALCVLAKEAGIPDGVFNMLVGSSREIGAAMTSNRDVCKLTFTCSTPVGKVLMEQCVPTCKIKTPWSWAAKTPSSLLMMPILTMRYGVHVASNRLLVQAGV